MPINVRWDNEQQSILRVTYIGHWTADEQLDALDAAHAMLDSVAHQVAVIIDLSGTRTVPKNLFAILPDIARSAYFTHPNTGCAMLVGANQLIITFSEIMVKAFPYSGERLCYARTMEDAYATLSSRLMSAAV
jgi:hypothetical protein